MRYRANLAHKYYWVNRAHIELIWYVLYDRATLHI